MIRIDRLCIRVPSSQQHQAREFVDALANALAQKPVGRDVQIESLALPPLSVSAGLSTGAIADCVAEQIFSAIEREQS